MSDMTPGELTLLLTSYKDQIEMNGKLLDKQNKLIDRLEVMTEKVISKIGEQTLTLSGEHYSIKGRINVALVGMVSVILTLLGLIIAITI
jgi:hypothetical protein